MSLETWKAEFYPKPASECSEEEALQHSLRKWTGLLPRNIKKHGVRLDANRDLYDPVSGYVLEIDGLSCALCEHYLDDDHADYGDRCPECPLFKVRGATCDAVGQQTSGIDAPWHAFKSPSNGRGSVMPMLRLLRAAAKAAETSP